MALCNYAIAHVTMKIAPRSCAAYMQLHVVAYLSQALPAHPAGWFHPPLPALGHERHR